MLSCSIPCFWRDTLKSPSVPLGSLTVFYTERFMRSTGSSIYVPEVITDILYSIVQVGKVKVSTFYLLRLICILAQLLLLRVCVPVAPNKEHWNSLDFTDIL